MRKLVAFSLVIVMMLTLCACTPEKKILGTWAHETQILDVILTATYTFREDGTGVRSTVVDVDFTYTIDGDVLRITTVTLGISHTDTYTYAFDGDHLILTENGTTTTLTKVK